METGENRLLIEYKPIRKRFFIDPYGLSGEEKVNELNKMFEWIEEFDKIENPSFEEKEAYYIACMHLEAEAIRRVKQFELAEKMYSRRKIKIVSQELEDYKTRTKLAFMEKFGKEISSNQFTSEMMKEMDKLERMEKASCYIIHGISITPKECDTCVHKSCRRN